MKILLLIKDKHETGKFPELAKVKSKFQAYNNGHGIEKMLLEMIDYSEKIDSFQKNPMLIEDMEFLKTDSSFKEFIKIITEFSIQQRYYYIDTLVMENENTNFNPFEEFKKLIWSFEQNIDIEKQSYQEKDKIKLKNTIICIEKGTRAISRFFTHGFGDLGQRYYYEFSNFILLKDEDLGKLKYSDKQLPPSEFYSPISTFSLQFLSIKARSKSKKIKSSDCKDWAFTSKSVTIYSHKDYLFFVEIDNEIFALTGKTSRRFKIPTYFKSKNLKPRMYATYLLEEAKKLREHKNFI
ncbi:hypothetical protein ACTS9D_02810 [Empedobacter brevis]